MKYLCQRLMSISAIVVMNMSLLGCMSSNQNLAATKTESISNVTVQQISIEEAMKAWRNKEAVIFIDVRTAQEYQQGHVGGASLIPLAELENRQGEIPKDKKVFLICRSGNRSSQANAILQKSGFSNTYSVTGGMQEWKEEVEK